MEVATYSRKSDGEALVKKYLENRNQENKDKAIRAYLPLVKYIIGRISIPENGMLKREDIYQFGIIGLLDALERFQSDYGVTFKTYAYRRIHGEVVDAIRRTGILNKDQIALMNRVILTTEKLRASLGREPAMAEICRTVGITEKKYAHIRQLWSLNFTLSLDDGISTEEDDTLTRKDTIVDEDQVPPDVAMEKEGLKAELKEIIKDLPERQRLILALYYYEELTLLDIGQVLRISESRVSQILSQTLIDIRSNLVI